MMRKKGQAAMEFLMTYGWAILVVLVAIGALAYFGVLNPSGFLPSSCTLMPGLGCDEFKASTISVVLVIRNGMGDSIDFSALDIIDAGTAACDEQDPALIADGAQGEVTLSCTGMGAVGNRFKGTIRGTYTKGSSTLSHTLSGTITTRVE